MKKILTMVLFSIALASCGTDNSQSTLTSTSPNGNRVIEQDSPFGAIHIESAYKTRFGYEDNIAIVYTVPDDSVEKHFFIHIKNSEYRTRYWSNNMPVKSEILPRSIRYVGSENGRARFVANVPKFLHISCYEGYLEMIMNGKKYYSNFKIIL